MPSNKSGDIRIVQAVAHIEPVGYDEEASSLLRCGIEVHCSFYFKNIIVKMGRWFYTQRIIFGQINLVFMSYEKGYKTLTRPTNIRIKNEEGFNNVEKT